MVVTYPDGQRETLLSVPHYDFNWQITCRDAQHIFIPKRTRIAVVGHLDNGWLDRIPGRASRPNAPGAGGGRG